MGLIKWPNAAIFNILSRSSDGRRAGGGVVDRLGAKCNFAGAAGVSLGILLQLSAVQVFG